MSQARQTVKRSSRHTADAVRAEVRHLEVDAADAGRRLDNYLFTYFKGIPKSHIYRVIRSGQVRINSGRVPPSRKVAVGDLVRVPPLSTTAPPLRRVDERETQRFEDTVIFEDEHLLVLNKPGGLVVHGGSRHSFGIIEMSRRVRGDERFPALVHRLDRGTSGCLLLAKSSRAMLDAQRAFRERKVKKTYIALALGAWDEAAVQVCLPLTVRSQISAVAAEAKVIVDKERGKSAQTDFKISERFDNCTLLNVTPQTGRMHQIRVHAAACGHPLAGDGRYGDFAANRHFERLGLKRLFLHASRLSLECMGNEYDFAAPLPDELSSVVQKLPAAPCID